MRCCCWCCTKEKRGEIGKGEGGGKFIIGIIKKSFLKIKTSRRRRIFFCISVVINNLKKLFPGFVKINSIFIINYNKNKQQTNNSKQNFRFLFPFEIIINFFFLLEFHRKPYFFLLSLNKCYLGMEGMRRKGEEKGEGGRKIRKKLIEMRPTEK